MQTFKTKQALITQQRKAKNHDVHQSQLVLVITNQCPRCETVLASVPSTKQHVRNALDRGYCRPEKRLLPRALREPSSLQCPLCGVEHQDLKGYNQHVSEVHMAHIGIAQCNQQPGQHQNRGGGKKSLGAIMVKGSNSADISPPYSRSHLMLSTLFVCVLLLNRVPSCHRQQVRVRRANSWPASSSQARK